MNSAQQIILSIIVFGTLVILSNYAKITYRLSRKKKKEVKDKKRGLNIYKSTFPDVEFPDVETWKSHLRSSLK